MTTAAPGNDSVRDLLEVGAFFGLVAGIGAWGLVLGWTLVSRLWRAPLPIGPTLILHLGYVLAYVALGALAGLLWPVRGALMARLAACGLMTAAGALTVFSVSAGPAWRWPATFWMRYLVAVVLFALAFAWPGRRR